MNTNLLSPAQLKSLRYVVVHRDQKMSPEARSVYDRLYHYWTRCWSNLYKDLASHETLNPEDFYMQDKITAIMSGDEFVGIHLLKNYQKKDFQTHRYFRNYQPAFLQTLQDHNVAELQSFQFFWVDPAWSKKATGVNFAAIIASMSIRFQKEEGLDATITIARKDIKVHETAEKLGFKELVPPSTMHNVEVAQMACFEPQLFPNPDVVFWADYFWNNRTEYKKQTNKQGAAA